MILKYELGINKGWSILSIWRAAGISASLISLHIQNGGKHQSTRVQFLLNFTDEKTPLQYRAT